jgi:hypothetical protein
MAFTDQSDLFGAVHEDGINLVVRHIMRQRPSLFNYATSYFIQNRDKLCAKIDPAREVTQAGNPLFTVQPPMPIPAAPAPIGLNYCIQFTDFQIDFHPGNTISLPPELGQLPGQRFALRGRACVGLDCPSEEVIREILPGIEILATAEKDKEFFGLSHLPTRDRPQDTVPLPTSNILCFCLELFAVGHFEWGTIGPSETQWLKVRLDGLEIVDLKPQEMEDMIECYIRSVLRLGVLPRMSISIEKMVLDITEMLQEQGLAIGETITLEPAPVPASVPNNPAVENDQLKVFINLVITKP